MAQNEKNVDQYLKRTDTLPVVKGHIQSEKDLEQRKLIQDIMCRFRADISGPDTFTRGRLEKLEHDGIIEISGHELRVTAPGRAFIRNVCAIFDEYLKEKESLEQTFSKAI
ncbi:Oxygen-independent coproporphyrinogen III oxidase [compost metagenome]